MAATSHIEELKLERFSEPNFDPDAFLLSLLPQDGNLASLEVDKTLETLEGYADQLKHLKVEADAQVDAAVERAQALGVEHKGRVLILKRESDVMLDGMQKLESRVASVGGKAMNMGKLLDKVDRQRRRAHEAGKAIRIFDKLCSSDPEVNEEGVQALIPGESSQELLEAAAMLKKVEAVCRGATMSEGQSRAVSRLESASKTLEGVALTSFDEASALWSRERVPQALHRMRTAAQAMASFSGKGSIIQRYIATRSIFIDESVVVSDADSLASVRTLEGAKQEVERVIEQVSGFVKEEAKILPLIFSNPEEVMTLVIKRVCQERILCVYDGVLGVLLNTEGRESWLKGLGFCFSSSSKMLADLKAEGLKGQALEGLTEEMEEILNQNRSSFAEEQVQAVKEVFQECFPVIQESAKVIYNMDPEPSDPQSPQLQPEGTHEPAEEPETPANREDSPEAEEAAGASVSGQIQSQFSRVPSIRKTGSLRRVSSMSRSRLSLGSRSTAATQSQTSVSSEATTSVASSAPAVESLPATSQTGLPSLRRAISAAACAVERIILILDVGERSRAIREVLTALVEALHTHLFSAIQNAAFHCRKEIKASENLTAPIVIRLAVLSGAAVQELVTTKLTGVTTSDVRAAASTTTLLNQSSAWIEKVIQMMLKAMLDETLTRASKVLNSKQKPDDFIQLKEAEGEAYSEACSESYRIIQNVSDQWLCSGPPVDFVKSANAKLDANTLSFFTELAKGTLVIVKNHIRKFKYSPVGSLQLLRDLSGFQTLARSLQAPLVVKEFEDLRESATVLVMSPENLLMVMEEGGWRDGNITEVMSVAELRSDWGTLQKKIKATHAKP